MLKQKERIERLHQLIRLNATGTPKECAQKLGISERQLYNIIELMKELGAPIIYSMQAGAYQYIYEVDWSFGFTKKLDSENMTSIMGSGITLSRNYSTLKFYFGTRLYNCF